MVEPLKLNKLCVLSVYISTSYSGNIQQRKFLYRNILEAFIKYKVLSTMYTWPILLSGTDFVHGVVSDKLDLVSDVVTGEGGEEGEDATTLAPAEEEA